MTPEAINKAIAKECLYYVMQDDSGGGWKLVDPNSNVRWAWTDSEEHAWSMAPEYYTDLNAMHEAERELTQEQQFEYHNHLFDILPCDENHGPINEYGDDFMTPSGFTMLHATSQQRAEAFLRTVGKWRDT